MTTLQLNVPEAVIDELRQLAADDHRPMEEVAASILARGVASSRRHSSRTAAQLVERAQRVRSGHPQASVTEEFLRMAKNDGRP